MISTCLRAAAGDLAVWGSISPSFPKISSWLIASTSRITSSGGTRERTSSDGTGDNMMRRIRYNNNRLFWNRRKICWIGKCSSCSIFSMRFYNLFLNLCQSFTWTTPVRHPNNNLFCFKRITKIDASRPLNRSKHYFQVLHFCLTIRASNPVEIILTDLRIFLSVFKYFLTLKVFTKYIS